MQGGKSFSRLLREPRIFELAGFKLFDLFQMTLPLGVNPFTIDV